MTTRTITETISKISSDLSSFISVTPETKVVSTLIDSDTEDDKTDCTTQPLSLKCFRKRVSTFSPGLWSVRYLSPLTCARYGWILAEKEILQCVTCRAVVYTHLPPSNKPTAYDSFLEVLGSKLVSGHVDGCGWQHNPCPQYFCHPPNVNSRDHLKNFTNHARSLAALGDSLPYVNNKHLCQEWGIQMQDLTTVFGSKEGITDDQATAVLLCLSGWTSPKSSFLQCNLCQRSIGLWSYCSRKDYDEEFIKLQNSLNDLSNNDNNSMELNVPKEPTLNNDAAHQESADNATSSSTNNMTSITNGSSAVEIKQSECESSNDSEKSNENESMAASEAVSSSSEATLDIPNKDNGDSEALPTTLNTSEENSNSAASSSCNGTNNVTDMNSDKDFRILSLKSNLLNNKTESPQSSCIEEGNKTSHKRSLPDESEVSNEDPTEAVSVDSQASKRLCTLDRESSIKENMQKKNKRFFDAIEEHRHWCGWIAERSLTDELNDLYYDDLRGFKVLMDQIKAYLRPTPSELTNSIKIKNNTEGLRVVRSLLEQWVATEDV